MTTSRLHLKSTTTFLLNREVAVAFVSGLLASVKDWQSITITRRGSFEDSFAFFVIVESSERAQQQYLSEQRSMSAIPLPGELWAVTS